jgi:hypothetical protein
LEDAFNKSSLHSILLTINETASTNSSDRSRRNTTVEVETKQHLQRITGFIALYFGIDAAYVFLTLLDLIPLPANIIGISQPHKLNEHGPFPLCLHTDFDSLCRTLESSLNTLSLNRRHLISSIDSPERRAKKSLAEKLLELAKQNKELSNAESTMMMPGNKEFKGYQFQHVKQILMDKTRGYHEVNNEDLIV